MTGALLRYRIMANVIGVLLIVLVLVGVPLKYLTADGSSTQQLGEWITTYLGIAHGWLYMVFLVMAFWLSRLARWSVAFTVTTLLCGTIPILTFWAEHRATARVRAQMHPGAEQEAAGEAPGGGSRGAPGRGGGRGPGVRSE